jgi:M6 family metalloprotease-like protein
MKKRLVFFLIILPIALFALNSSGANIKPFLRKISPGIIPNTVTQRSVSICALRVSFQEDDNEATTGTGKFLYTGSLPCDDFPEIDPPPHNNAYFKDHIRALANYYGHASNGKLEIDTLQSEVFPLDDSTSYQLPRKMEYYHPFLQEDSVDIRLAELFVEAVQLADSVTNIDFSQYNVVVVFHAGVGQDFDLFLDPTPYDIPSVYLNSNDLTNYFTEIGETLSGFPVDRGLILPESQNHLFYPNWEDVFGGVSIPCDYQIGLNGTFAFMMGFYLGLPGLYNTETGETGVGKFGLMDQGSANLNGLVPSYPSAWEREFMGWDTPVIAQGFNNIKLKHAESGSDTTLWKIPINDNEYFLVENRYTHVRHGVTLDSIQYKIYIDTGEKDWPALLPILVDSIKPVFSPETGVMLSTPRYDVGLPGSGLLIWHIDKSVINANLATNSINVDREHRGVDLEEADGAQDLGYESQMIGASVDIGWYFDPWFAGNEGFWHLNPNYSEDDEKRIGFTGITNPSSRSNNWAYTGIAVDSIGPADAVMTFRISEECQRFEDENIKISSGILNVDIFVDDGATEFITISDSIYLYLPNTEKLSATSYIGFMPIEVIGLSPNTFAFSNEIHRYVENDTSDRLLQVWRINGDYQLNLIDTLEYRIYNPYSNLFYDNGVFLQVIQTLDRQTSLMSYSDQTGNIEYEQIVEGSYKIVGQGNGIFLINCDDGSIDKLSLNSNGIQNIDQLQVTMTPLVLSAAVGFIDANNIPDLITVNRNGIELILNPGSDSVELKSYAVHSSYGDHLALSDIDGDTRPEILLQTSYDLYAFNEALLLENNYPISVPNQFRGTMFDTQLLTSDVDGDGLVDVITMLDYTGIISFNYQGELIDGFPKSFPMLLDRTVSLLSFNNSLVFCGRTAEPAGHYTAIQLSDNVLSEDAWYTGDGNRKRNNYYSLIPSGNGIVSDGLLNKHKTFNWPNPTKFDRTAIRYFPTADCNIAIDIYDLAGDLVKSFKETSPIINDYNEIEWNVSNIANGVYFAVVKATSGSKTESKIVKIMVIH